MAPLRELGDPVADLMGPLPYTALQSLLDPLWPQGKNAYMKAGYLRGLDDAAIATAARYHREPPRRSRRSTSTTSAARSPGWTRTRRPTASARRRT